jgi:hypothetical protein
MSVPGIRPLNPPYPRKVADALAAMMQANVAPLRLFRTFARNLPMPQAMQPWRRYELSADLSLSLRDREILIDPTCIRCRCEHESSVHTKLLRRQGAADASPGVVAGVRLANRPVLDRRAGSGCSSPPQTHCTTRPPSARICGERSASVLDEEQRLDLLLSGWYHAVCFAASAARVQLEDHGSRVDEVIRDAR